MGYLETSWFIITTQGLTAIVYVESRIFSARVLAASGDLLHQSACGTLFCLCGVQFVPASRMNIISGISYRGTSPSNLTYFFQFPLLSGIAFIFISSFRSVCFVCKIRRLRSLCMLYVRLKFRSALGAIRSFFHVPSFGSACNTGETAKKDCCRG